MFSICIRLLGPTELLNAETHQKVRLPYIKLTLLIAYLALENKAHTRESLANLFWPELEEDNARANLRRALFNLQQAFAEAGLEKSLIHADRHTVHLTQECIWIDVLEFESMETSDCTATINQQLMLYKGAFLDGIFPVDEELARWVQNRRIHYEQKIVFLLERAIVLTTASEDFDAMERGCRRLLSIDSANELGNSFLMRMHMELGNEAVARKIYDAYKKTLQMELGIAPSPQLTTLMGATAHQQQAKYPMGKYTSSLPKVPACEVRREYRLVSVLYSEMVPCNPMDNEEWLKASATAVQHLHALVSEYKGTFRQLSSTIAIAYFGYPAASECAVKWAIDVGLRTHKFITTECNHIEIRSAVHTDVMITSTGTTLPDVIGECTMIARHLAESTAVGTLLASEETLHEITSFFDVTPAPDAPHQAFQVHAIRESKPSQLYRDDHPFVGRTKQLRELENAWKNAKLAGGANALLIGGAGCGKSRLLSQFLSSTQAQRGDVCLIRYVPEDVFSPLRPVLALIRRYWKINQDTIQEIEHKLNTTLVEGGISDRHSVQLFAKILCTHGEFKQSLSKSQRDKLFFSIAVSLRKKIQQAILVTLVIEDIQWADALSLDFISWLREKSEDLHLFLLITSRKCLQVADHGSRPYTQIDLTPFPAKEATMLALQHPQFRSAPSPLQQRLIEMADGVPLFMEQILTFAFEHSDKIAESTCPISLRNLFMAQIDWLGDIRQILCHASCIGWRFTLPILAAIESISHHRCRQFINKMIAAELVEKLPGVDQFQFRYRLIREVAYSTLMREEQQKMQVKIANFYVQEKEQEKRTSSK